MFSHYFARRRSQESPTLGAAGSPALGLLASRPRPRPSSLSPPLPPFLSPLFLSPLSLLSAAVSPAPSSGRREAEKGGREGLVSIFLCGRGWSLWRAGGERGDPGAAEPWMARRGAMDSAKSGGRGRSETGRGAPGVGWGPERLAAPAGPGRPRSPRRRAPTRKTMGSPRPPPRPGPDPRGGSGESPPRPKRTSLMDLP